MNRPGVCSHVVTESSTPVGTGVLYSSLQFSAPICSGMNEHVDDFFNQGFTLVRGALCPAEVAAFLAQLEDELTAEPGEGEGQDKASDLLYDRTDLARVSLCDSRTWPAGKKRRVVECAPFPPQATASHWDALRNSPALAQVWRACVFVRAVKVCVCVCVCMSVYGRER